MKNYMFSNMFVVYKRATNLIVQHIQNNNQMEKTNHS